MGNSLNKNSPGDNEIPTPKITELSENEIKIIKETWKIPSANVSEIFKADKRNFHFQFNFCILIGNRFI